MDLDDLEQLDGPNEANARTSKFAPKSSKFAPKSSKSGPKPKANLNPKPESKPEPQDLPDQSNVSIPKKEESKEEVDIKPAVFNGAVKMDVETKLKAEEDPIGDDAMEEDHEHESEPEPDMIVREIDVFLSSKIDSDTQLYLLQYPLRPSWKPYEFDRCEEVRVEPTRRKVEVDLSLETDDTKHYDDNKAPTLAISKMTLHAPWVTPLKTGYAVGVLTGDKFHLNPIHAAAQLRPSRAYATPGSSKKKVVGAANVETTVKKEGQSSKQSKQAKPPIEQKADDEMHWVALRYHDTTSDSSSQYLEKMMTEENSDMQFTMKPHDYVDSFCPGPSSNTKATGPSRRSLLSLPLEERFKTLLTEGPPFQRFNALKHFAGDASIEDVFKVLHEHGHLLQGLWIPKTKLVVSEKQKAIARDYVILLFSKKTEITDEEVKAAGSYKDAVKGFLKDLAIERPGSKDWKLKEQPDVAFMKEYPDVVKKQEEDMKRREEVVMKLIESNPRNNKTKPRVAVGSGKTENSDKGKEKATSGAEGTIKISDEILEGMPKLLKKVFSTHKVCSLQQLRTSLRNLAVSQSTIPKQDNRLALAAEALSENELKEVVKQYAVECRGVYVPKSSPNNPEHDAIRSVVIKLFLVKEKIKKAETKEAVYMELKRQISDNELQKVMGEICDHKGSGWWYLKTGDGEPTK